MKCPKCHINSPGDFCVRCGYIDEETRMKTHKINFEKSDLEKYLKNYYTRVLYNQNKKIVFLLGPLYFAYLNYFYLSFVLGIIDIFVTLSFGYLFESTFVMVISFILNRFLYVMFANSLYMYLTNKKISKWKKKYDKDYIKILQTKKSKNYFLPLLVITSYVVLGIFVIYLYRL